MKTNYLIDLSCTKEDEKAYKDEGRKYALYRMFKNAKQGIEDCLELAVQNDDNMVSHPSHYQSENGLEVIDVIEAFTFDLKGIEATDTGNIIKYICRWKKKNGLQDLKKAMWYLNHLIEHAEKMDKENTPRSINFDFESNKKENE